MPTHLPPSRSDRAIATAAVPEQPGDRGDTFTTLPRESYFSREWFDREQELIFSRQWLYAGHESEIREAGDFITREIGDESVIVTRDESGDIHALFNVCRHRGARICSESSGSAKRLVCPYHRWTYALDGRLLGAPAMPDSFEPTQYPLQRAHVCSWNGLVFVSLAIDRPEQLGDVFERVQSDFDPFDVSGCKVAHSVAYDVAANWKLILDNYYECYHCPGTHPELCRTFDLRHNPGGGLLGEHSHLLFENGHLPVKSGARSFTMTGEPVCNLLMGRLREEDMPVNMGFSLHPTTSGILSGDYGIVFDFQPVAPTRTRVRCQWLVAGDAVEGRDYDVETLIELWDVTNRQDWPLCELTQQGVLSRRFVAGPNSAEREPGIDGYRSRYVQMMGDGLTRVGGEG